MSALITKLVKNEAGLLSGSGSNPKLVRPGVYGVPGADKAGMSSVLVFVRLDWVYQFHLKQFCCQRRYQQKRGGIVARRRVLSLIPSSSRSGKMASQRTEMGSWVFVQGLFRPRVRAHAIAKARQTGKPATRGSDGLLRSMRFDCFIN